MTTPTMSARSCALLAVLAVVVVVVLQLWQTRTPTKIIVHAKATLVDKASGVEAQPRTTPVRSRPPPMPRRPPSPPRVPLAADKPVGCLILGSVEGSIGDQALTAMAVFARAYQLNMGYDLSRPAQQHGEFWQSGFLAPLLHQQRASHLCHPSTRIISVQRGAPIPNDIDPTTSVTLTGTIIHVADIVDASAELRSVLLSDKVVGAYRDVVDFDKDFSARNLFVAYRPYYDERMPHFNTPYGFYERAVRLALQDGNVKALHVFSEKSPRDDFIHWITRTFAPIQVVNRHVDRSPSDLSSSLVLMATKGTDMILCNSSFHLVAALLARPQANIILDGKAGAPHVDSGIPHVWNALPLPELVTKPPPLSDPPCNSQSPARTAANPFKGRIILTVNYNGEDDILEAHMYELYDLVDLFIVMESNYTFQGQPKPRFFPKFKEERLSKFPLGNKLIYADGSNVNWQECISKLPPPGVEAGERFLCEIYQRKGMLDWVPGGIQPDDLFTMTDVDMIVNRNVFQAARKCDLGQTHATVFVLRTSHYSLHFAARDWWFRVWMMPGRVFDVIGRDMDKYLNRNLPGRNINENWLSHGYHLSWFGTPETILYKIQSFAESQLNRHPINTLQYIMDHALRGVELLERGGLDMDYRPYHDIFAPWFAMANPELRSVYFLYDSPR